MRTLLSITFLTWLAVASVLAAGEASVSDEVDGEFMRGMVVSCPGYGRIWGSPQMAEALGSLETLGVEWVAIHPYAGVRRDGSIHHRPTDEADYLERANGLVRAAGMGLFWKPHLAYWGSFDWRGAISFDDEQTWERFFAGYREFILDQAGFAETVGAELFAIGVELELTTHRPEWLQLIGEVREVYSGQLTYAANWDRVGDVPFWERLDLIGVHAYFPLSTAAEPTRVALDAGWDAPLADLRRASRDAGGKPVFFAEIGYNRSPTAAAEPWSYAVVDSPTVRSARRQLIEVAIGRIEREPLITGMFWWKWIPGPTGHDRDFSMKDPEAREALRRLWGDGSVATAE